MAAALILSLALPAGAWACNFPAAQSDGGDPPNGTGPGEPVYFLVYNIDDGAKWEVTRNGEPFSKGVVPHGSGSLYRGSFRMPDLGGQAETVTFDVRITHLEHDVGERSWDKSFTVRYRGTGSPTPSPQAVDRPSTPQPQPAPQQVEAPSGSQPTGIGGSAPVGGTGGTGGVPPTGPGGPGGGPMTPSAPGGPSGGPLDAGADVAIAVDEPTVAIEDRALAPAARAALPDRAMEGACRPALQAVSVARTDSPDGSGRILLVLIALTAAGSAAAFAVRWRRGGSGPAAEAEQPLVPSDPAVEAELQEVIAEERAKLPRAPDERPPAELAATRDDPG
jgi:hypothetical protein